MTYLLDTCILSKLRRIKKSPDLILEKWISKHSEDHYFLSVLTIGEIQKGIHKLKNSTHKRILDDWLSGEVVPRFSQRLLDLDFSVSSKWGELCGSHEKRGKSLPTIDSLIAATAITHNLILVTHNSKDFQDIQGLKFYNPWEDTDNHR